MRKIYDLRTFDEDPNNSGGAGSGQQQQAQQRPSGAGGYSFEQAEEIANSRAQRAEKAALASYFKQAGLSEEQVTEAIQAYKAEQAKKTPDVAAITKERDDARAELETMKQEASLAKKGVKADDVDYVSFKVRAMMREDDKLTFDKAADSFLKEHPRFTNRSGYRVKTVEDDKEGQKASGKTPDRAAINAAIRSAVKR